MSTTTTAPVVTWTDPDAWAVRRYYVDGRPVATARTTDAARWQCSPEHEHGPFGGMAWTHIGEHVNGCGRVPVTVEYAVYLDRSCCTPTSARSGASPPRSASTSCTPVRPSDSPCAPSVRLVAPTPTTSRRRARTDRLRAPRSTPMPGLRTPTADLLHAPMTREDFRKAVRARQREGQARRAAELAAERAPAYWSCCGQWDETIRDKGHLLTCPFPS